MSPRALPRKVFLITRGKCTHTHVLEIAPGVRRQRPMRAGLGTAAVVVECIAEQQMNITLIRKQVFRFSQISRSCERSLEMCYRGIAIHRTA